MRKKMKPSRPNKRVGYENELSLQYGRTKKEINFSAAIL